MKSPSSLRVGKEFMFGRDIIFPQSLSIRDMFYFSVCRLIEQKNFSCMKSLENEKKAGCLYKFKIFFWIHKVLDASYKVLKK